jgi:hypothetical protein
MGHTCFVPRYIHLWSPFGGDVKIEDKEYASFHYYTIRHPPAILHTRNQLSSLSTWCLYYMLNCVTVTDHWSQAL